MQTRIIIRTALRSFLACALATASIASTAAVINVDTNATWLTTNAAPAAGWNTNAAFDTSAWRNATVVIPACQAGTDCIWYDGQFSATGSTWFRQTFTLSDPVISGLLSGGVDDDADIFINGTRVLNDVNGSAGNFGPLDVTSLLVSGTNLIAVYATDNIPVYGQNHAYVSRLTITTRDTNVPEPTTLGLLGLGLAGVGFARRKRLA